MLVAFRMAFDRTDRLAVEEMRRRDARANLLTRTVRLVEDHDARMAYTLAAAEARAGQAEILVQEINQHERGWHLERAHRAAVDRKGDRLGFETHERAFRARRLGGCCGRVHASTS